MGVRILMVVAVLLGAPDSASYEYALDKFIGLIVVALLSLLAGAAVLVTAFHLIRWLLSEAGRAALRSSLNRFRTVWTATSKGLRMAWIGLGVLFFVMVVVPGALLIYQYSGIGD
jgi:hypothetical protein